jgi:hypothetical protein
MRARRLALLAGGAAALLAAVPGFAATLGVSSSGLTAWQSPASVPYCAAAGSQTVTATADATVIQNTAGTNFGTATTLAVRSQSANRNRRALVRFALPATPANCTLTQARLRLFAATAVAGRTLRALRVNAAWVETGVTWTNQPATTGTGVTTASAAGWREWVVTADVAAQYAGANNGFLVRDNTEGGGGQEQVFHSREQAGGNPPELVVTFG